MPTIYEDTPLFEERIEGAALIIIGQIEKPHDVKVDYSGDPPQVQTIYRVTVENVLKGTYDQPSLTVRVVGGQAEKVKTDWSVQMKEGGQMLLMLAQDYGPDNGVDMFVPYFSSFFPVKEGVVRLDRQTAEELANQQIPLKKSAAKVADIRTIIHTVEQRREKEASILAEMEPVDIEDLPYDEVTEMPQAEFGEPRSSSPERLPEELIDEDY